MTFQHTALLLCSCVDCKWFSFFCYAFRVPIRSSKPENWNWLGH